MQSVCAFFTNDFWRVLIEFAKVYVKYCLNLRSNSVLQIWKWNLLCMSSVFCNSCVYILFFFFFLHYSYLLTNQPRARSVNDIMPMIGARFYTQLDAAQMRNDVLEEELAKEVMNGRLLRLISKLGIINERPE